MAAARQRPALAAALAALAALLAAAAAAAQQVEAPAAAGGNRSDVDVEDPSSEVVDVALAPILGALLGLCLRAAAAGSRQQQRPAVWCWAAAVVLAAAAVLPGVAAQAASAPSEPLPTQAPGEALTKPAAILGWDSLATLSASALNPCGVFALEGNTAACWGRQLAGGGAPANDSVPTTVGGGETGWRALSSGYQAGADAGFTCGIGAGGDAACWGSDAAGLGVLGSPVAGGYSLQPVPLPEPGPWQQLSSGGGVSLGIKAQDCSAWAWGTNEHGALGCGATPAELPSTAAPCQVASGAPWLAVTAGLTVSAGIQRNGSLWMWGALQGAAGAANRSAMTPAPVMAVAADVTLVALGASEACFLTSDSAASCFALGEWPPRLQAVPGGRQWQALAVGADHKCGITAGSQVLCWGANTYGQCGTGAVNARLLLVPTPIDAPADAVFTQIEAGNQFTAARTLAGSVYTWGGTTSAGYTVGELGDGSFRSSSQPVLALDPVAPPPSPPPPPPSPPSLPPPSSPPPSPPPVPVVVASSAPVGAVVGGVFGGLALLAAGAGGAFVLRRRRRHAPVLPVTGKLHGGGGTAGTSSTKTASRDSLSSGIPAAWLDNELVTSDPLLSWISTHVPYTPPATASVGAGFAAATAGGSAGSGTGAAAEEGSASPAAAAAGAAGGAAAGSPAQAAVARRRAGTPLDGLSMSFFDLRMERVIGAGSFGKVYLAKLGELEVAVKVLLAPSSSGDERQPQQQPSTLSLSTPALRALHKEAGLMASVRHPHIVRLLGVCESPPALVTEFCSRGSVTDLLLRARGDAALAAELTWARRLRLALDAAEGMQALHAHSPHPILHRDLKGPNLLVDDDWRCKIADFNLSKMVEEGLHLAASQSTAAPMNPRWLAPELMTGARASAASDVYSMGIVLWELLCWAVPWSGVDFWEIVSGLLQGDRPAIPPRESLPGPDTATWAGLAPYCALMQACWAADPAARPSFAAVIDQLRRLLVAEAST